MVGRKKKLTDRSQRILETAAQLFRHYGFEKTSLEDIAKGAGISKGSIYLEFNSKDDILLGVIEQSSFQEIDKMKTVASQTHENICDTLHQMMIDHILHVYDKAHGSVHSPEVLIVTSARVMGELSAHFEMKKQVIADLLVKAALNNEIKPLQNPLYCAHLVMMSMAAFFPPHLFYQDRGTLSQDARVLLSILLNGFKQDLPQTPSLQAIKS